MGFLDEIKGKEIIICVGSGGVGKTSAAASIAIAEAFRGRNVLALTIDPAKRLANSMGLKELGNEETRIDLGHISFNGKRPKGQLHAMMLDTKLAFDATMERLAPNKEVVERIFANRFYQHISSAMTGADEYMGLEKLHELREDEKYDLIVLDTPPTKHAINFLESPQRMLDFFDTEILQWFLKPYLTVGKLSYKAFKVSSKLLLKTAEKLTGYQVIQDITDFFEAFESLYDSFRERAHNVNRILREDYTAFILVAGPNRLPLEEAVFFVNKLREMSLPLSAVIMNRVHEQYEISDRAELEEAVKKRITGKNPGLAKKLMKNLENYSLLSQAESRAIETFKDKIGADTPMYFIPMLDEDVHDMEGLLKLARHIYTP